MTATATTITQCLTTCPACGKPIDARILYQVHAGEPEHDGNRPALLKPSGVTVKHDCMPSITRG